MENIEEIYNRNVDTIYRVCFGYLKNSHDSQDAVEDTFVKLMQNPRDFENKEHEKAWLIRTAVNVCKNVLRQSSRKNVDIDTCENMVSDTNFHIDETLQKVLELTPKLRIAVYLYYYEGYSTAEIAKILGISDTAVRMRLSDARKHLKQMLGIPDENFIKPAEA